MVTANPQRPWHLIRTAILRVGSPPLNVSFQLHFNGVDLNVAGGFPHEGKYLGVLAIGAKPLGDWTPGDGPIQIPHAERREIERAIEVACRLAALDRGTSHSVASPIPALGLIPPEPGFLTSLDGVRVELAAQVTPLLGGGPTCVIEDAKLQLVWDRLDGVAILTEALNAERDVGQFTQFWRLFERAFKAGHRDALPALTEFLLSSQHEFTVGEVEKWGEFRNPAVHANRRGSLVLTSDVYMLLGRMREASFDVLFNKKTWWSGSAARRDGWRPATGSAAGSNVTLTPGKAAHLELVLPDPFGTFPYAFVRSIHELLPEALWLDSSIAGSFLRSAGSGTLAAAFERGVASGMHPEKTLAEMWPSHITGRIEV